MDSKIYLIGLNYRTATVDVREKFALTDPALQEVDIVPLDDVVHEVLILSTCNRVEIAAVGQGDVPQRVLKAWAAVCGHPIEQLTPFVYTHKGAQAIEHLFTVAASLDSMVLGEPQILGQLKDAYKHAVQDKTTKVILNRLLHKAFSVAKRVRSETAVASSAVSISYAAVELAKRIFGDMSAYRAMLIGAGEMAELAATHLVNAGIKSVSVANRTYERAVNLAEQFNGEAIHFDDLFSRLAEVDIVISSTGSSETIIQAKDMKQVLKERKNRPMFFIDIAVPRDIAPDVNGLDNIYLYDIDDLKEVVEENMAQRREEADKARAIVHTEAEVFCSWLRSLDLQPTIIDLIRRTENIAHEELDKTLRRIGPISPEMEEALSTMLIAMTKKINHEPITFLKRRFAEEDTGMRYVDLARRMFNLDNDLIPSEAHDDRKYKWRRPQE